MPSMTGKHPKKKTEKIPITEGARPGIPGQSFFATLHRRPIVHLFLIFFLGMLIYSNTFHAPFQWDEEKYVVKNPWIKDLSYFTDISKAKGHELYYPLRSRYIGYLTFALNYKMNEFHVLGYHIVNITIHLFNALLVYFLVILTFKTPILRGSDFSKNSKYLALFASLLFVSHPLQTEAVTYIFQRLTSLVSLFFLASVVSYLKSRLSEKKKTEYFFYIVSLASAILAMKTKENAFTLPIAIILYEFLFFKGTIKERLSYLIPFCLILFVIPFTLLAIHKPIGEIIGHEVSKIGFQKIPRAYYFLTQFRVIVTYLRLLLFPVNQNLEYDYPLYRSFFSPAVFLSFVLIFGILCFSLYLIVFSRRKKPEWRLVGFGMLWFFLALSVESSIIPIPMLIDEYRAYLPSIGFFMAITTWGFYLIGRFENKKKQRVAISAAIGIILILSYATYMRNSFWKDKVTLWGDVVRKSPNKASAYINRALAYKEKNMYENSISDFKKALSLSPDHVLAHHNLGALYLKLGRLDDAMKEAQSVLNLSPNLVEAHLLLGMILGKKNRYDEGIHEFEVAANLAAQSSDVHNADFHHELATLYYQKGRFDDAMKELQIALDLKPDFAGAHKNLAVLLIKKNRFDDALRELQTAIMLKPDFAEAHNDLGSFYVNRDRLDEGMKELQLALKLKPDFPEAHKNLATAHLGRNRLDDALKELQIAIKLKPDFAEAYNDLGYVYALQGRMEDALLHFQRAVSLAPDNLKFAKNLQKAKGVIRPTRK